MAFKTISLLAAAAPLFLAACNNTPSPLVTEPLRAGAEKSVPVTQALPPAAEHRYEPGIAPDNEEKGLKVGEVVAGTGGQEAQKEKERKEQAQIEAEQARRRAELARQQNADAKVSTQ
jgi:hypothetical protein